jgi:hypothetical protein
MKVNSRSFPESICTPGSKSIRGRGGRHKLMLFWNPNAAGANAAPFHSYPSFMVVLLVRTSPSNQTRNLIMCRCGCITGVDVHITCSPKTSRTPTAMNWRCCIHRSDVLIKKGKQLHCNHHAIITNRMLVRNDHLH